MRYITSTPDCTWYPRELRRGRRSPAWWSNCHRRPWRPPTRGGLKGWRRGTEREIRCQPEIRERPFTSANETNLQSLTQPLPWKIFLAIWSSVFTSLPDKTDPYLKHTALFIEGSVLHQSIFYYKTWWIFLGNSVKDKEQVTQSLLLAENGISSFSVGSFAVPNPKTHHCTIWFFLHLVRPFKHFQLWNINYRQCKSQTGLSTSRIIFFPKF